MNIFIPTRNRACQLDLLLRSLQKNLVYESPIPCFIVYDATSPEYTKAYHKLFDEWKDERFPLILIKENIFRNDFLDTLKQMGNDLVLGLTDDSVFYSGHVWNRKFLEEIMSVKDVLCVSLRLGNNTTIQDCATGKRMVDWLNNKSTRFNGLFFKWRWVDYPADSNPGYPVSLDGHIYRANELHKFSSLTPFENLRQWEGNLISFFADTKNEFPESMVCPQFSNVVNIPLNMVQEPWYSTFGKHGVTTKYLNDQFLAGKRLSMKPIENEKIIGSHQEIKMGWDE